MGLPPPGQGGRDEAARAGLEVVQVEGALHRRAEIEAITPDDRITPHTFDNWAAQGALTRGPDELVYHNGQGERLPYSTFYDEWMAAVKEAKELGLLPAHKNPTFHDLRHSHAAALISAGHSLTYVQRRPGHESIKTTSDLYGHLLPETDDAATSTIDASRAGMPITNVTLPEPAPVPAARRAAAASAEPGADVPSSSSRAPTRRRSGGPTSRAWSRTCGSWSGARSRVSRNGPRRCGRPARAAWMVSTRGCPPARRSGNSGRSSTGRTASSRPSRRTRTSRVRSGWQWEEPYTTEPAHWYAEHRPGPDARTLAALRGVDEKQVRAAYVKARAKALRICGRHPDVAGAAVGQVDS